MSQKLETDLAGFGIRQQSSWAWGGGQHDTLQDICRAFILFLDYGKPNIQDIMTCCRAASVCGGIGIYWLPTRRPAWLATSKEKKEGEGEG